MSNIQLFNFNNNESVIKFKNAINKAVEEADQLSVITASDVNECANYIKKFKDIEKKLEELRKEKTKPLTEHKKEIDNFFKEIKESYQDVMNRLSTEIVAYKRRLEAEERERARKEQEALRIEQEKERERLQEEMGTDLPEPIVPEVVQKEVKVSSMNSSNLSTARYKTIEIIDESQIPREYMIPDMVKIRNHRNQFDFDTNSDIPGVKFTYIEKVR